MFILLASLRGMSGRSFAVQFKETGERFGVRPILAFNKYSQAFEDTSGGAISRRPRLLFLDDNPVFLRALGRLLETHSFNVDMEGCHKAAFNRFFEKGSVYDLALVNVHLKGTSGWDFARKINELPDLPPLLITSGEALSLSRDAPKKVKGILTKPFSAKRLKEVIDNWGHSV